MRGIPEESLDTVIAELKDKALYYVREAKELLDRTNCTGGINTVVRYHQLKAKAIAYADALNTVREAYGRYSGRLETLAEEEGQLPDLRKPESDDST